MSSIVNPETQESPTSETDEDTAVRPQPPLQAQENPRRPPRRLTVNSTVLYASRAGIWRNARLLQYLESPTPLVEIKMLDIRGTVKTVNPRMLRRFQRGQDGLPHNLDRSRQSSPGSSSIHSTTKPQEGSRASSPRRRTSTPPTPEVTSSEERLSRSDAGSSIGSDGASLRRP